MATVDEGNDQLGPRRKVQAIRNFSIAKPERVSSDPIVASEAVTDQAVGLQAIDLNIDLQTVDLQANAEARNDDNHQELYHHFCICKAAQATVEQKQVCSFALQKAYSF